MKKSFLRVQSCPEWGGGGGGGGGGGSAPPWHFKKWGGSCPLPPFSYTTDGGWLVGLDMTMELWLSDKSPLLPTWKSLYEILRQLGFTELSTEHLSGNCIN